MFELGYEARIFDVIGKDPSLLNITDSKGLSLMHLAIYQNDEEMLTRLVDAGASVNATDSLCRSLLYYAVFLENLNLAYKLIDLNADLNLKTKSGEFVRDLSKRREYSKLTEILQSKGAKESEAKSVTPELYMPIGHKEPVLDIAVSMDGKFLLSIDYGHQVKLWEIESAKEVESYFIDEEWTINFKYIDHQDICNIEFSPDAKSFLLSGNHARIYDIHSGYIKREYQNAGLAYYSPDGKSLVFTGYNETKPLVYDIINDSVVFSTLLEYEAELCCFSPDGALMAVAYEEYVYIYDIASAKQIQSIYAHYSKCNSLEFSADGKRLLTSGNDKTVKVWDVENGEELFILKWQAGAQACFSPDGKYIASGGFGEMFFIWNAETGEKIRELTGHKHEITSLVFTPDSKTLLSSSFDKRIIQWDIKTGKAIRNFGGHSWRPAFAAFTPDGESILISGDDYTIKNLELSDATNILNMNKHKGWVNHVSSSDTASVILSCGDDKAVRMWDMDGNYQSSLQGHDKFVTHVEISPDGKHAFSIAQGSELILWDLEKKQAVLKFENAWKFLYSAPFTVLKSVSGFSSNGNYLIIPDTALSPIRDLLIINVNMGELESRLPVSNDMEDTKNDSLSDSQRDNVFWYQENYNIEGLLEFQLRYRRFDFMVPVASGNQVVLGFSKHIGQYNWEYYNYGIIQPESD